MTTRGDFARAICQALNAPFNYSTQLALVTGMTAEDSHAANNPLDTTEPGPEGTTDYNSVGVKNYPTLEAGVKAVLDTLTGPEAVTYGYVEVVEQLRRGSSADSILRAFGASSWGGAGNYLWLDTLPRVTDNFGEYSTTDVAGSPPPTPAPAAEVTADEHTATTTEEAVVTDTEALAKDEASGKVAAAKAAASTIHNLLNQLLTELAKLEAL